MFFLKAVLLYLHRNLKLPMYLEDFRNFDLSAKMPEKDSKYEYKPLNIKLISEANFNRGFNYMSKAYENATQKPYVNNLVIKNLSWGLCALTHAYGKGETSQCQVKEYDLFLTLLSVYNSLSYA